MLSQVIIKQFVGDQDTIELDVKKKRRMKLNERMLKLLFFLLF